MILVLGLVAVVAVVAFAVVLSLRSRKDGTDDQIAALKNMAQAKPEAAGPCRMLVAPEYPFSRLDGDVRGLGLAPTAPITQDEPEQVTWADEKFTVTYRYTPSVGLRALELAGRGEPQYLRNDLLNGAYTPSLEGYKVSKLLDSSDPRECRLGILAAEWIGTGADHRYYLAGVDKLRTHADSTVAAEAQRVHAVLLAESRR